MFSQKYISGGREDRHKEVVRVGENHGEQEDTGKCAQDIWYLAAEAGIIREQQQGSNIKGNPFRFVESLLFPSDPGGRSWKVIACVERR